MSGIFGSLNLSDSDRVFNSTAGQQKIYDIARAYVERVNRELDRSMSVFVERETEDFKFRYELPGGGYLQRRGPDGRPANVKATGYWDVSFPLEDFGASIGASDVAMAYMTVGQLDRHIQTVVAQNVNTVRYEMLKALFSSSARTFLDDIHGSLSIQPLANGDSVLYPPVDGSDAEATDNHYLESGYLVSAISDTNNPYVTIADELSEHFGDSTGNDDLVVFINPDARAKTEALADFVSVPDNAIRVGDDSSIPVNLPNVPGKLIGRVAGSAGAWVSVWRHVPATYMLGVRLDAPAPLIRRVDPADTGLGRGLQLVARDMNYPFEESFWRHRLGLGVGNRLNGVAFELGNGGSYGVPSAFS